MLLTAAVPGGESAVVGGADEGSVGGEVDLVVVVTAGEAVVVVVEDPGPGSPGVVEDVTSPEPVVVVVTPGPGCDTGVAYRDVRGASSCKFTTAPITATRATAATAARNESRGHLTASARRAEGPPVEP